ncbi:MAG: sugar ABC transporter permease [Defluviitaleaceae bacterium]|nr:sugar ABC transporter permease [Defluviitaleaceae bacterium]
MSKTKLSTYLFILPAFLIYTSVIIVPALQSIWVSFHRWNGMDDMEFVGLGNFSHLFFEDLVFWGALRNNLVWMILTLVFMISVSLGLAMLLNAKFKGRTFFRGLFYFPFVLSGILVGIIWRWMYNVNFGFLNEFLSLIGLDQLRQTWLGDPNMALFYVFIAALWRGVGAPMILFLAGLQTIPEDVLEAADIDGASRFKKFFSIKLPMLKETFVIVLATQIIGSMGVFDIIVATTGGGPGNSTQVLASYMVQQTFSFANMGMGAALSTIMLVIMMIVVIPYVLFTTKER